MFIYPLLNALEGCWECRKDRKRVPVLNMNPQHNENCLCEGREVFKTDKQYKTSNTIWCIIAYIEICFSLDHFQCFIKQDNAIF